MDRLRVTDLTGRTVVTKDGIQLGDVVDLDLDPADWRVHWIYLRLHRALTDRFHIDAPFVMGTRTISFSVEYVANIDKEIALRVTLEEIIPVSVVANETDATNHLGRGA